jgi:membrane protein YdbS with pleckstrin-like domain
MKHLPEQHENLWRLTWSPGIWIAHFLLSYLTAAIWCAKVGAGASLSMVRVAIVVYTLVALAGIAITGWQGYRRHRHGTETGRHDFDSPAGRHGFLGFATLLLSGLSAVATVYVALAAVFIGRCW